MSNQKRMTRKERWAVGALVAWVLLVVAISTVAGLMEDPTIPQLKK